MKKQATPTINVDDGTTRAENLDEELVDKSILRVAEHDPGDGREKVRDEEGNRDQQLHQAAARNMGARHRPRKGQGQNETDCRPGRRIDNAIEKNLADAFGV